MSDAHDTVGEKVRAIFEELAPGRAHRLENAVPVETSKALTVALSADYSKNARDIAFHLTDWNSDAAFIVAALLFPERFTQDELAAGAGLLLVHAPNHLAAAATLANFPIQDIFEVGVPQLPDAKG